MELKGRTTGKVFWVILGLALMMAVASGRPLFAAPSLTLDQQAALRHMYEEEKLARDVYTVLYDKWQMSIFNTIKQSEQRHMDSMKGLLVYYSVPFEVLPPGQFSLVSLQNFYDELLNSGMSSKVKALEVGVNIETTDIADLDAYLGSFTYKNIVNVYQNLRAASQNHLDAFNSQLGY